MAGDTGENNEQHDEGQGDGGGAGTEEHRILTLSSISDRLDKLTDKVEQFFSSGSRPGGAGPNTAATGGTAGQSAASVAEQRRGEIRDELAALKKQEAADAQAQATQDRLGKLEKLAEKPPRELRKIEQFFGWGDA